MQRPAAPLLFLAAAAGLASCAAPAAPGGAFLPADAPAAVAGFPGCVPAFCADGRLRRDFHTEAPLFVASAGDFFARAPRFNDDGTVDRDPETGAPVYEVVLDGQVVRVIVALP